MAKLLEVIEQINLDLIANQLGSKKFQKGRFSALAEPIPIMDEEVRQTKPTIVANDGDTVVITMNDAYPFELYHRHISTGMVEDEEDDYGDRILRKEESQVKMVVIGDRLRLDMTKEEIITAINLGIRLEMPQAFLTTNALQSVVITPATWNVNQDAVYREEYNLEEVNLNPTSIFISLDYTVETSTYVACIDVCSE